MTSFCPLHSHDSTPTVSPRICKFPRADDRAFPPLHVELWGTKLARAANAENFRAHPKFEKHVTRVPLPQHDDDDDADCEPREASPLFRLINLTGSKWQRKFQRPGNFTPSTLARRWNESTFLRSLGRTNAMRGLVELRSGCRGLINYWDWKHICVNLFKYCRLRDGNNEVCNALGN